MGSVDDRTFKANFTGDGVTRLRGRVKDKLKELMGDYTDDTLVEYVIVLLRNGRRKDEARNELNVFLGDDSSSFVSWLWDHLDSDLSLYVQPEESQMNEVSKMKPTLAGQAGKHDTLLLDTEPERGQSNKLSRSRHNREWKGLVRDLDEPPPLPRSEVENIHFEEKTHRIISHDGKSPPPRSTVQKKRSRHDEQQHTKREVDHSTIDAPRRLLQFAVRDAVGTTRPFASGKEPSVKRLRSVVSTSTGDSEFVGRPRRIRSVATVPNPLATVMKAVAEAAEDVKRIKSGGNVFDRLGCSADVSVMANRPPNFGDVVVEDNGYGNFSRIDEHDNNRDMTMVEHEPLLAYDSMSDNERYDDIIVGRRVTEVCQVRSFGANKGEDTLMLQFNVDENVDDEIQSIRFEDQDQPVAVLSASHKIASINANINTWKPHKESRVRESDGQKSTLEIEASAGKAGVQLMKENSSPVTIGDGNAKPAINLHHQSQQALQSGLGLYAAGHSKEDADSRTLFIKNVHFAATKDSLSRHFNKFGEVLKVVIVADSATGLPTGSAFVEFIRKEEADNALCLDGTSFMSRILKVVKRTSAHQHAVPLTTWPRSGRGSPYAASRFTRAPFPRGMHGTFRPHLHIKPGARSMQWKRDALATPSESGAQVPGIGVPSPIARSLTYVRPELKTDGNSGTT